MSRRGPQRPEVPDPSEASVGPVGLPSEAAGVGGAAESAPLVEAEAAPPVGERRRAAARGMVINSVFFIALGTLQLLKAVIVAALPERGRVRRLEHRLPRLRLRLRDEGGRRSATSTSSSRRPTRRRAFQKAFTLELASAAIAVALMAALAPLLVLALRRERAARADARRSRSPSRASPCRRRPGSSTGAWTSCASGWSAPSTRSSGSWSRSSLAIAGLELLEPRDRARRRLLGRRRRRAAREPVPPGAALRARHPARVRLLLLAAPRRGRRRADDRPALGPLRRHRARPRRRRRDRARRDLRRLRGPDRLGDHADDLPGDLPRRRPRRPAARGLPQVEPAGADVGGAVRHRAQPLQRRPDRVRDRRALARGRDPLRHLRDHRGGQPHRLQLERLLPGARAHEAGGDRHGRGAAAPSSA